MYAFLLYFHVVVSFAQLITNEINIQRKEQTDPVQTDQPNRPLSSQQPSINTLQRTNNGVPLVESNGLPLQINPFLQQASPSAAVSGNSFIFPNHFTNQIQSTSQGTQPFSFSPQFNDVTWPVNPGPQAGQSFLQFVDPVTNLTVSDVAGIPNTLHPFVTGNIQQPENSVNLPNTVQLADVNTGILQNTVQPLKSNSANFLNTLHPNNINTGSTPNILHSGVSNIQNMPSTLQSTRAIFGNHRPFINPSVLSNSNTPNVLNQMVPTNILAVGNLVQQNTRPLTTNIVQSNPSPTLLDNKQESLNNIIDNLPQFPQISIDQKVLLTERTVDSNLKTPSLKNGGEPNTSRSIRLKSTEGQVDNIRNVPNFATDIPTFPIAPEVMMVQDQNFNQQAVRISSDRTPAILSNQADPPDASSQATVLHQTDASILVSNPSEPVVQGHLGIERPVIPSDTSSVREILIDQGISPEFLTTVPHPKDIPIVSKPTDKVVQRQDKNGQSVIASHGAPGIFNDQRNPSELFRPLTQPTDIPIIVSNIIDSEVKDQIESNQPIGPSNKVSGVLNKGDPTEGLRHLPQITNIPTFVSNNLVPAFQDEVGNKQPIVSSNKIHESKPTDVLIHLSNPTETQIFVPNSNHPIIQDRVVNAKQKLSVNKLSGIVTNKVDPADILTLETVQIGQVPNTGSPVGSPHDQRSNATPDKGLIFHRTIIPSLGTNVMLNDKTNVHTSNKKHQLRSDSKKKIIKGVLSKRQRLINFIIRRLTNSRRNRKRKHDLESPVNQSVEPNGPETLPTFQMSGFPSLSRQPPNRHSKSSKFHLPLVAPPIIKGKISSKTKMVNKKRSDRTEVTAEPEPNPESESLMPELKLRDRSNQKRSRQPEPEPEPKWDKRKSFKRSRAQPAHELRFSTKGSYQRSRGRPKPEPEPRLSNRGSYKRSRGRLEPEPEPRLNNRGSYKRSRGRLEPEPEPRLSNRGSYKRSRGRLEPEPEPRLNNRGSYKRSRGRLEPEPEPRLSNRGSYKRSRGRLEPEPEPRLNNKGNYQRSRGRLEPEPEPRLNNKGNYQRSRGRLEPEPEPRLNNKGSYKGLKRRPKPESEPERGSESEFELLSGSQRHSKSGGLALQERKYGQTKPLRSYRLNRLPNRKYFKGRYTHKNKGFYKNSNSQNPRAHYSRMYRNKNSNIYRNRKSLHPRNKHINTTEKTYMRLNENTRERYRNPTERNKRLKRKPIFRPRIYRNRKYK